MEMNNTLRLVVVTIVKDDVESFNKTLESVRIQSLRPKHVVIDGSSAVGNRELISLTCREVGSTYVYQEAKGIYSAMNYGLSNCEDDDLVLFLNSGDCFADIDSVKQIDDDSFSSKNSFLIYPCVFGGRNGFVPPVRGATAKTVAMGKSSVCHQGVVASAGLMRRAGAFDESYAISADHKLLLQLLQLSQPLVGTTPLAVVALGGVSDTNCSKLIRENERARSETGMSSKSLVADKSFTLRRLLRCKLKLQLRTILRFLRIPETLPQRILHRLR